MTRASTRPAAWYRVLISLWGVWFATVLTEPAGLMACPLHSGHGAQHASATAPSAHQHDTPAAIASSEDAGGHGEHASHAAFAAGIDSHATAHSTPLADAANEQAPSDGGHACCTCLGQCCTAAPAAAVHATPTIAVGLVRTVAPFATAHAVAHTPRRAYALPFANGPPTRV